MPRILGLDFGERRIGIAVSDPGCVFASGLTCLEREGRRKDKQAIEKIILEQEIAEIVVGHPLNMDGSKGPKAAEAEAFAKQLQGWFRLPVHLVDERLTTLEAQRSMREMGVEARKQKRRIDQAAAQRILQHFLEMQRGAE